MEAQTVINRAYQIIGQMVVGQSFDADEFKSLDQQINDLQLDLAAAEGKDDAPEQEP